jgi:hypothetical protein
MEGDKKTHFQEDGRRTLSEHRWQIGGKAHIIIEGFGKIGFGQ